MMRALLFAIFAAGILLPGLSCKNNQPKAKETPAFYYYPGKNVYYDIKKKAFLYSLDGAKTWVSLPGSAGANLASLGKQIPLYSSNSNVYADNAAHLKEYNGNLLDIPVYDTAPAKPVAEVAVRKVVKKKPAAVTGDEEKTRTGVGKLLNKIFGRHRKK